MVVKVYISGISGNKEVKKRQQRVLMILDSKSIKYDVIDITEPGREVDKDFMQSNSKSNGGTVSDPNPRSPLPPQLFNDEEYCGDYDKFDLANEVDTLEQFLKLEVLPEEPLKAETEKVKSVNGNVDGEKERKESTENAQESETENNPEKAPESKETPAKEGSPVKDGTPVREATPADEAKSKEATPVRDTNEEKDTSPEKEMSPERQISVDKESTLTVKAESPAKETEVKSKSMTKENTPEKEELINENGTVSSRDQSEEKDAIEVEVVEKKKDNPSELLIQSEQTASGE